MKSNIDRPERYLGKKGDLLDAFEGYILNHDEMVGAYKFNIIKYVTRFVEKNGIEDLDKAEVYIKRLKKFLQEEDQMIFGASRQDGDNSKKELASYCQYLVSRDKITRKAMDVILNPSLYEKEASDQALWLYRDANYPDLITWTNHMKRMR